MSGSGLFTKPRPEKPHLVEGKGGLAGEIDDLRADVAGELAGLAALTLKEWDTLDIAVVDDIKEVFQSLNATAVEYTGAELDGTVGVGALDPPRNITVTTGAGGTPGESPSEATITGTDIDGAALSEVIALSQSAGTDAGVKAFASVSSVALKDDGTGTGAALQVGFGDLVGLDRDPVALASLAAPALIHEVANTGVVTNGVLTLPADGLPHGTYAPNGGVAAVKYAIMYPYDPTV